MKPESPMTLTLSPIGVFHTQESPAPRHWSVSQMQGWIDVDAAYREGLKDITPGQAVVVLFHFHKSPPFKPSHLIQTPPHKSGPKGVFSICSPVRPNPIGLSVLRVIAVSGCRLTVQHADMLDGTPILDIKPHIDAAPGGSDSKKAPLATV